ncbi:glycosyltransferase family 2 protein [Negadavirga shengliensis]|uniref:Glycosyltransferase family 2 protein n=1 Tax=Negadavirga shengliensis TaxID=1389218 RepID=A0ABV9SXT2_9BACT
MNDFLVSIVVPCYNEAENIPSLLKRIGAALQAYGYEIILVNDGSQDLTQSVIELAASENEKIKFLHFSRNFGHQAALKAGIDHAKGDCVVTIDADLQKPPEAIPGMIVHWQEGHDIVTAVCKNEGQPSVFKRLTSAAYYRLLSWLADHKMVRNGADFRLIDRKVADTIRDIQSQNLYLRGIFSWMGYKQAIVYYREEKRRAGKTKYNLPKMLNLASNGITSFSIKPLRLALGMGIFFAMLAFGYGLYAVTMVWLGKTVTGWASLVASVVFLSGVQLIVLGVIGEYVGKIYQELSQRPNYLIFKSNISPPVPRQGNKTIKERRPAII